MKSLILIIPTSLPYLSMVLMLALSLQTVFLPVIVLKIFVETHILCTGDAGRLAPEIQRESCRTSQEGHWLCIGWKSNSSQQAVKAEFIEGIEGVQIQKGCLGDSERKGGGLVFIWVWGFLLRTVGWCLCPLRHPGTG